MTYSTTFRIAVLGILLALGHAAAMSPLVMAQQPVRPLPKVGLV